MIFAVFIPIPIQMKVVLFPDDPAVESKRVWMQFAGRQNSSDILPICERAVIQEETFH